MVHDILFTARTNFGKGGAKKLRKAGEVPCVITSSVFGPVHLSISKKVAEKLIQSANFYGKVLNVKLEINGKVETINIIASKADFHPVNSYVMHIDFLHVVGNDVLAIVPVKVLGADKAPGLKRGGKLNLVRYHVPLNCQVNNIPESVEVNISTFGVGRSLFLSKVALPQGVTMAYDCLVLSITGRGKKDKAEDESETKTESK